MREVEEVFCYGAACRQELLRAGGRGWDGRAVRDGGGYGRDGTGGTGWGTLVSGCACYGDEAGHF